MKKYCCEDNEVIEGKQCIDQDNYYDVFQYCPFIDNFYLYVSTMLETKWLIIKYILTNNNINLSNLIIDRKYIYSMGLNNFI